MKLEDKLFHSFFYPFLIGVILNMFIIILFSIIFTNNYIDKRTSQNLLQSEKNLAELNLKAIQTSLTSYLLKIQASINEIIISYQKNAKNILLNPNLYQNLDDKFLKCALDLNDTEIEGHLDDLSYMGYWFIERGIKKSTLKNNSLEKKQLIAFSEIIPNLYSAFGAINSSTFGFYFYFEQSEIYISFPLLADYLWDFTKILDDYHDNSIWCTDNNGKIYTSYKIKCRPFYINIQKAKTEIFDYNSQFNNNRTIFVTEFYYQSGMDTTNVFTICVQFDEPITEGKAYICADISQDSLIFNFDNFNEKLKGYFLVTAVGFNHVFYFPNSIENAFTPAEIIFNWNIKFFMEEKIYFLNHIQKLMTSNYIKQIVKNKENHNILDEVYINGENTYDQYFRINQEVYNFSIFPVIFENIEGNLEHVLNIIYIYNIDQILNKINTETNVFIKVILELIIFIVFGSGLLFINVLSFNTLAKYIVIPIKNVNYMLKGINIGGKNRLDYLDFLKKKQDENIEMIERFYMNEEKKNNKNKEKKIDNNNNLINGQGNDIDNIDNEPLMNKEKNISKINLDEEENNQDIINYTNIDYDKKFDEESIYIENELSFYNYDEYLLQFRPLEIENLIKALIELKEAIMLTKFDNSIEYIIDYSNSEGIFRKIKNKDGETLCQSNIGNLQIQLMKYDKAIYHIAISLQNNRLIKFFNRNLFDEFDESNNLLNKISSSFNLNKNNKKINALIKKQLNSSKDNFSQKAIGILINARYTILIYSYYKFFSILQKTKNDKIKGQFINKNFHNINYYHKIVIQYIFLSFVKNDLIKIGESILDYNLFN